MRILVRGTTKGNQVSKYISINTDSDGLSFQLGERINGAGESIETVLHGSLTVDLKTLFKSRTFYNIFEINRPTPKGIKIALSQPMDSKMTERGFTEDLLQRDFMTIMGKIPIIVIYFHEAEEDVIIIVNTPINVDTSNVVFEEAPFGKTLPEILQEQKPDFEAYYKIIKAREKLLRSCEPNMSLACMEAQLDILTRLVFLSLEANPTTSLEVAKTFPKLKEFTDIINDSSLLNVKAIDKCLSEIANTKAKIRGLQAEYFAAKEANK